MKSPSLLSLLCATSMLVSVPAAYAADSVATPAAPKSEFTKALTEGKPIFDARYRYEYVDQDGLANEANAHTVRTRLGYETGKFKDFSALLEFENITGIGSERYNDTINGRTTYPTVADPEDTAA
jgi:hypothetical protein